MLEEPKLKDRLGRSWRFAPPEDDGKFFTLSEAGWIAIELLDDHGPLPTTYIWHEVSKVLKDELGFKKWLRKAYLRSRTPDGGAYITRPPQQKAAYRADRQPLTHDITEASREALQRKGLTTYPPRFDHMHHRFMNACVTASLRFAAADAGLAYIRLKDILDRHTCPEETKKAKNPLAVKTAHGILIPDDLCGLGYPGEVKPTYRFIAFEQDRATETLDAIDLKLQGYLDVLRNRLYEDVWGITNLNVAVVTTAPQRMRNMIDRLEKLTRKEPKLRQFFLFKHKRIFHEEWLVPPIMTDLLTDPWERAGMEPLLLDRP